MPPLGARGAKATEDTPSPSTAEADARPGSGPIRAKTYVGARPVLGRRGGSRDSLGPLGATSVLAAAALSHSAFS